MCEKTPCLGRQIYDERAKVEASHSLSVFITICHKGAKLSFCPGASHDRFGTKFRSVKFHVSRRTAHVYDSISLNLTRFIYFYSLYTHIHIYACKANICIYIYIFLDDRFWLIFRKSFRCQVLKQTKKLFSIK